jgi:hypothetical protein
MYAAPAGNPSGGRSPGDARPTIGGVDKRIVTA